MKIGFLGFGEVSSTLSAGLLSKGADVSTCVEGRSLKTKGLAKEIELNLCKSNRELAESSDILISAVTPFQAVEVAKEIGKYSKGIYIDINNISPSRAKEALSYIENGKTADASIIGSVRKNGLNVNILVSGPYAKQFAELNQYGMNINIIGNEIGQASAIKLLRSSFTKGISALLFETLYSAYKMGIDGEVLKYIAETEGEGFRESAVSRIISSAVHSKRKAEEMEEVMELISKSSDAKMSRATSEFFKQLYNEINGIEKRPENYKEIFELINKKNRKN
ncbi:NAD(P)-binding domain-containing protein [Methanobacterium sp.]|uniref:NAD(P)-binding domain-containing protein n=1 Tax=Methanobacterium sp. TaxID=2164 RepID=UPI003C70AFED